eukprot:m.42683 g.42683  ORF g.42683 m.42683 type:complete len:389 (+) comp8351_c0_seq1:273-1439(+)
MPQATPRQMRAASEMLASAATVAGTPIPLQHTLEPQRKDYLSRVETFTVGRWFAKPTALSPLECARYGWQTCGVDRLECPLCAAKLVCFIKPDLDTSSAAEVTAEFKLSLGTKHEPTCYWRENPLPVDVLRGPHAKGGRDLFLTRLTGFANALGNLTVPPLTEPNATLANAAREHQAVVPAVKEGLTEIFALAAAGWKATASSPHGVFVQCECCQARAFLGRSDFLVWSAATSDPNPGRAQGADESVPTASDEPPRITKTPPRKFPPRSEIVPASTKQLAAARIGTGRRFGVPPPTARKIDTKGEKRSRPVEGAGSAPAASAKRARVDDSRDFNPLRGHRGFCPFYEASLTTLVLPLSESSPQRMVRQNSSLTLKGALDLLKKATSHK